jgi:hypothetical protein
MARTSLDDLIAQGSALVRHYAEIEETKTQVLKDLAVVVWRLRSRFRTNEGGRDWAGQSYEYRMAAARMYEEAGVPTDSVANVQAALRYHVGNVLREKVPAEELREAGLLVTSPRERITSSREEAAAALEAFGATTEAGRARKVNPVRLATAAAACLARVEASVGYLDPEDEEDALALREAAAALHEMRDAIDRALALIEPKPRRRSRAA